MYCDKCGMQLTDKEKFCPRCGNNMQKKQQVGEATNKKKGNKDQRKQKSGKTLVIVIIILTIIVGIIAVLYYNGWFNNFFRTDKDVEDNSLAEINRSCITVEEKNIVMENDSEGTAEIIVKMPDYATLFKDAYKAEDSEMYLYEALSKSEYEIREIQAVAEVTRQKGITQVHTDEVVDELLENALLEAANELAEENE